MTQEQKAYLDQLRNDPSMDQSDIYLAFTMRYGVLEEYYDHLLDELLEILDDSIERKQNDY